MLLFCFENVVIQGQDATEKSSGRIDNLDWEDFQLFFDEFTENGKLKDAASDFSKVKDVVLDEFSKKKGPQ